MISYRIPTYYVGRRRVYLGPWKEGVSLHATRGDLIEYFKQRHPAIKTGKGSLNFRLTDELPEADIRAFIKQACVRLAVHQAATGCHAATAQDSCGQ